MHPEQIKEIKILNFKSNHTRKFNLKSDRVNLVALASPIECLLYLSNVWAIQYKL